MNGQLQLASRITTIVIFIFRSRFMPRAEELPKGAART
jgi:hypothetical protein